MNILITGANGFVGKTLLRKLQSDSSFSRDEIILLTSAEIDGFKCIEHKNYTFSKNDFLACGIDKIDVVIHLGSSVPRSRSDYLVENGAKFATNVRNTIYLYENLPSKPDKFIYISSVDVYSGIYNNNGALISEDTPLSSETLYAASKIMCEKYLEQKSAEDGFILQILRFGQIYGNGEEVYSKIVSSFVKQIANGQQIKIFGDGTDLRSQLLVDDCVDCVIKSIFFDEAKGAINLVSNQAVSVKEIVLMIYRLMGITPDITYIDAPKGQSNRFDNTKMKKIFSITETPIKDGISAYIDYYRKKGNIDA